MKSGVLFDDSKTAYLKYQFRGGNSCEIEGLYVHPAKRRKGTASRLIRRFLSQEIQNQNVTVYVFTRASNTAANNLYQKLGFTRAASIKGFYPDGDNPHQREGVLYVRTIN